MFTNNGSTLQTDITTFGVNMKLAHLGRQALMGVMAVALVAGMSVKSFARVDDSPNGADERHIHAPYQGSFQFAQKEIA